MFNFLRLFKAAPPESTGGSLVPMGVPVAADGTEPCASRQKGRLGFLWKVPKAGQRCVLRHATGSRKFHPVIFTKAPSALLANERVSMVTLLDREKRIRILRAGTPNGGLKPMHRALLEAVREHQIELLHVFHGDKAVVYLPVLRELDLPITVSFHGRDVKLCLGDPGMLAGLQELFSFAAAIMPCSQTMGETLAGAGCPPEKLIINHWSIPMERFPFRVRRWDSSQPFIFFQACRLIDKKGLPDTIDAFHLVAARCPGAELWIAGDGELREQLEARVADRQLGGRVRFLGFLQEKELLSALHASHLFLHPSVTTASGDQEGIPNALLEAMASGLPAIATRHAGIPEVVTDGQTGWLVDEHAPEQLADRMLWCAQHRDFLETMAREAHAVVDRTFSAEARGKMLDQTYTELIGNFAPAARELARGRLL